VLCLQEKDSSVDMPETRYAKTADGVHIAYQVVGDGPFDLVSVHSSYVSNVELLWDWPLARFFMTGLAARGRLILFDRRGTGLSDKVTGRRSNEPARICRRTVCDSPGHRPEAA
jgi:pimeloyl-ACP methyl ester carboxylesterase